MYPYSVPIRYFKGPASELYSSAVPPRILSFDSPFPVGIESYKIKVSVGLSS
jgi:hypothetical protein